MRWDTTSTTSAKLRLENRSQTPAPAQFMASMRDIAALVSKPETTRPRESSSKVVARTAHLRSGGPLARAAFGLGRDAVTGYWSEPGHIQQSQGRAEVPRNGEPVTLDPF